MSTYEIRTDVTATVWKIVTEVGEQLTPGDTVMILESMKMEIPVISEEGGTVVEVRVEEGAGIVEGDVVAVVKY